jgi:hypothetical protein
MPPGWQIPDLHQWGGMRPAGIAPYPVRVAFVGVLDHDTNGFTSERIHDIDEFDARAEDYWPELTRAVSPGAVLALAHRRPPRHRRPGRTRL